MKKKGDVEWESPQRRVKGVLRTGPTTHTTSLSTPTYTTEPTSEPGLMRRGTTGVPSEGPEEVHKEFTVEDRRRKFYHSRGQGGRVGMRIGTN